MSLIFGKLQGWALTFVAVVLVLLGAYAVGGRAAKKAAKKDQQYKDALRVAAGAKGVQDAKQEVNKLDNGAAAQQLRNDWMRHDPE